MSDTIPAEDVSMEIHLVMPILAKNVCMGLIIVRIIGSTMEKVRCQMKLVIDIDEEDYRKVQDGRASVSMMQKAIRNGTPLDKIRAEIDEQYDRVHPYNISCAEGLEMALEIIDKYKAESER